MSTVPCRTFEGAHCRVCQIEKAQVILRNLDPYCSKCFLKYAVHKFRSTLGKEKAVSQNERILLAYSGGLSSGSMIQMIWQGLQNSDSQTLNMKMGIKPTILYIDDGTILNYSNAEKVAHVSAILDMASKWNFDIYTCLLEYSLANDLDQIQVHLNCCPVDAPPVYHRQLKELFTSTQSLTSQEDLLFQLKHRLLTSVALKLGFKKVFVGSSSSRLAGQLLAAVGEGRGSQIARLVSFSENRDSYGLSVEVMRPMREFFDREVGYLAYFHRLDCVSMPDLAFKCGGRSIRQLTEEFIAKLQVGFPGTTSTLFRVGNKMKSTTVDDKQKSDDESFLCLICCSTIEESSACSANSARIFSQNVSSKGPGRCTDFLIGRQGDQFVRKSCNGSYSCEGALESCVQETTELDLNEISLCYACRITMQECGKPQLLVSHAEQEKMRVKFQRKRLRLSVQQFLL